MMSSKSKDTLWHCYFSLRKGRNMPSENVQETQASRLGSENLALIFLLHVLTLSMVDSEVCMHWFTEGPRDQGLVGSIEFLFMDLLVP